VPLRTGGDACAERPSPASSSSSQRLTTSCAIPTTSRPSGCCFVGRRTRSSFHILILRRWEGHEASGAVLVEFEDPVRHQGMEMYVEVDGASRALDRGDAAGPRTWQGKERRRASTAARRAGPRSAPGCLRRFGIQAGRIEEPPVQGRQHLDVAREIEAELPLFTSPASPGRVAFFAISAAGAGQAVDEMGVTGPEPPDPQVGLPTPGGLNRRARQHRGGRIGPSRYEWNSALLARSVMAASVG